jgi:hypothetical protein
MITCINLNRGVYQIIITLIKPRLTALLLFIFLASTSTATASEIQLGHMVLKHDSGVIIHLVDVPAYNEYELRDALQEGEIMVFYGNASDQIHSIHSLSQTLSGETDNTTKAVANGVWLQESHGSVIEHVLVVKDYEETPTILNVIQGWLDYVLAEPDAPPELVATRTMVEFHEPYGVLETRIELLKVNDTSASFDWYDVTVSQELTPGSNSSGSDWEWNRLTYTMNGSMVKSNVFLSDYDQPPSGELPSGLFSFLWRVLNFNLKRLLPWLYMPEAGVEGVDMSDFSRELFMVQYRAPEGFQRSDEPLSVRHHYVLRVEDGTLPKFWQGAQVTYFRGSVIAGVPYYSHLMGEGYLELR